LFSEWKYSLEQTSIRLDYCRFFEILGARRAVWKLRTANEAEYLEIARVLSAQTNESRGLTANHWQNSQRFYCSG
ncbi:MAG TPA: hypothetical protein VMT42_02430, partial [candidate division Zixibacteria bacterium]|nr:hypothetical protein [candidate division Zixibacteria bacterium]